jgi:lysophospholipase L1-like esterase
MIMGSLFLGYSFLYAQTKEIAVNNDNIKVFGANYIYRSIDKLSFSRFSEHTYQTPQNERMFNVDKAQTNSGIRIQFATTSPSISLTFSPQAGNNRGAEFAVLQNNKLTKTKAFKGKEHLNDMGLIIENITPGKETLFEVVMPSFCNVALTKMTIDEKHNLLPFSSDKKPIYIALGNSITHGVGQGSATYLTYPYLLARKLNMNYYNLAVGGSKISQAIARQTSEMPQANLITILIGYNDLMFNNKSIEEYKKAYTNYFLEIRKNQPGAFIYCISLTHTRAIRNEKTGITPNDFRKALQEVVESLIDNGDTKVEFIAGDSITSEANLRQEILSDKTHFGIPGAALFAEELYQIISTNNYLK